MALFVAQHHGLAGGTQDHHAGNRGSRIAISIVFDFLVVNRTFRIERRGYCGKYSLQEHRLILNAGCTYERHKAYQKRKEALASFPGLAFVRNRTKSRSPKEPCSASKHPGVRRCHAATGISAPACPA